MTLCVVDASIAAKWFLTEMNSPEARRLLDQSYARIAPDLLVSEIVNVVLKRVRRGELTLAEAEDHLAAVVGLLNLYPSTALGESALNVAASRGISAYDAMYVSLALRMGCELITGDRKLYNALSRQPVTTTVWVADIPPS